MANLGGKLAVLALALALPWLAEAAGYGFLTGVASRILIFGLAALSLNLILGYGGMVSFGHAAFFGTGAYVVGILSHHATLGEPLMTWPVEIGGTESALIAWPAAMLVAALLALAIGALRLRTVAVKDRPCADFPYKDAEGAYDPAVLLDLDYTVFMPRRA